MYEEWGVTLELREDNGQRPPILGIPNDRVIRRFRGDFTFNRPGEYEFTLRATLKGNNCSEQRIWWAGKDGQNGKVIVEMPCYGKQINTFNDVLIPTEQIDIDVEQQDDDIIIYSGMMKVPLNSIMVSKFYPVQMTNWLAFVKRNDWWLEPRVGDSKNFQWDNKEALFLLYQRTDGNYVFIVPICIDNITVSLTSRYHDGSLSINTLYQHGEYQKDNVNLYIAVGKSNPYKIISKSMERICKSYTGNNFVFSQYLSQIDCKETPFWKSIGWCTWNSFYKDVTARKIIQGLEEFKSNGIPIEYLLIDDGWQKFSSDDKLECFEANKEKFPSRLDNLVKTVKSNYGINYVGLWHALQGYWKGVNPKSTLASIYRLIHINSENMSLVQASDVERFYNDYYSYLESQGIDFVKIDNQATFDKIADELPNENNLQYWKIYQNAIWRAASIHFNGRMIQSMAHSPNIIFDTLVSLSTVGKIPNILFRNSDDYFPNKMNSHAAHIYTNSLNNLWSSTLGVKADWDMFQSYHTYGNYHAAARALSGGPIYISDEIGKHDPQVIKRLYIGSGEKDDTKVLFYDSPARPCERSIFFDPRKVSRSLKIFNQHKDYSVIGMFNCTNQIIVDYIRMADIPNIDATRKFYGVYLFNNRVVRKLKFLQQDIWAMLKPTEFELAWFAPLDVRRSTISKPLNSAAAVITPTLPLSGGGPMSGNSSQEISVSATCFGLVEKFNGCLAVNFSGFTREIQGAESGPIFEANLSARGLVGFFVDVEVDNHQRENAIDYMSVFIDGVPAPVGSVIYEKHYAAPASGGGLLLVDTKLDNPKESLENINIEIHFLC